MAVVKRALLLSTGERYFALVSNFVTVALVSRILTPAESGVSVIGMAFVGIAMSAREFASANFLIQRQHLSRADVRGAFTVMLLFTSIITVALASSAPLLAGAYGDERLISYLQVISAAFFLELVAAPVLTLLRRDMAFGKIAAINTSGAVAAAAVTISLALLGFSYMSFAWAWVSSAVVTGLLAVGLSRQFWIFRPSLVGWRGMVAFGGYNGATSLLYKTYEALPYLLLGRILSLDAAALYSRGLMICQLPDKVILGGAISVILPAFSAEARQGRSLKQPYLNALGLITALQWPALLVLAVLAYPIVDLLLGDQWHGVVAIVQIVAIASLFSFSFELNYPVLVSIGAVHDIFRRALIVCPVSVVIITVAAFFGLRAVAFSLLLVIPFQAFVSLTFVRRHIVIGWLEIWSAVWRSAVVAAITVAGPLAVVMYIGSGFEISLGHALSGAALAAAGWLLGLWLTGHALLIEILRGVADFRRGGLAAPGVLK
jgi:O-antigen/teichoic acid export membrane protein